MARRRAKPTGKSKLDAWSFSRYYSYRQCPKKLSFQVHDKLKEPPNDAMKRGIEIHNKCEAYVLGKTRQLPKELTKFKLDFKDLKNHQSVKPEDQWCFTKTWDETDWFSSDAWLRIKVDAHHPIIPGKEPKEAWEAYQEIMEGSTELLDDGSTHRVIDFKTGKPNVETGQLQMSLYALGCFKMFEEAEAVIVELWFLDSGEISEAVYFRDDIKVLEKEWKDYTKKMLNDTRFDATPGYQCKWCFFSSKKGGPCSAG